MNADEEDDEEDEERSKQRAILIGLTLQNGPASGEYTNEHVF